MNLRLSTLCLLTALSTSAFAIPPENFYFGVFGGGGASSNFSARQLGTAYFIEAAGGPLAVNAVGRLNSESAFFYGAQLGYRAPQFAFSRWAVTPIAEIEGYGLSKNSFTGSLINNTARLPEHDFLVTYPMDTSVFLANAILEINNPRCPIHPYVGVGFGGAVLSIRGATSLQLNPTEPGVNHYNSNPDDSSAIFAGQIKLGLSYDMTDRISLFADYRWLYLADTQFVFGSTVYPTHAETSNWLVKLGNQSYNTGLVGVRFKF